MATMHTVTSRRPNRTAGRGGRAPQTPDGAGGGVATATLLRRCLLAVAALAVAGTTVELAMIRHWKSPVQVVAWLALAVLAAAAGLLAFRPSRRVVQTVRVLAAAAALSGALGVAVHVHENYEAGPLDARYERTWATMSQPARWWAAVSRTVGPAPPVAPGVLGQAALALFFATLRHPALGRSASGTAGPAGTPGEQPGAPDDKPAARRRPGRARASPA